MTLQAPTYLTYFIGVKRAQFAAQHICIPTYTAPAWVRQATATRVKSAFTAGAG